MDAQREFEKLQQKYLHSNLIIFRKQLSKFLVYRRALPHNIYLGERTSLAALEILLEKLS